MANAQVLLQIVSHHGRVGFVIPALHVGDHALESMAPLNDITAIVYITEVDSITTAPVEYCFAMLGRQVRKSAFHVKTVVVSQ